MKTDFKNNSLGCIRILAAFQVLYGHAISYLNVRTPELLNKMIDVFYGVPIFFTVSGFLIWHSISNLLIIKNISKKGFGEFILNCGWQLQ